MGGASAGHRKGISGGWEELQLVTNKESVEDSRGLGLVPEKETVEDSRGVGWSQKKESVEDSRG